MIIKSHRIHHQVKKVTPIKGKQMRKTRKCMKRSSRLEVNVFKLLNKVTKGKAIPQKLETAQTKVLKSLEIRYFYVSYNMLDLTCQKVLYNVRVCCRVFVTS